MRGEGGGEARRDAGMKYRSREHPGGGTARGVFGVVVRHKSPFRMRLVLSGYYEMKR